MSDLDAALEPVRDILERRDASRGNGRSNSEGLQKLLAAVATFDEPAAPTEPPPAPDGDWAVVVEQNLADVREIVKKLRNGRH